MKKHKWIKRTLAAAYPLGTPVAWHFGYPTSKDNGLFGIVTGYSNEHYQGKAWSVELTRYDGEVMNTIPVIPGRTKSGGWVGITTHENLANLELRYSNMVRNLNEYRAAVLASKNASVAKLP